MAPAERGQVSTSNTSQGADSGQLADELSLLARALDERTDLQTTLDAIVTAAVGTVPGAAHASISAVRGRHHMETLATTGELSRQVDALQAQTGQGPCLTTLYEHATVRLDDARREQRWPAFTPRAAALGMGSMLSLQLYVQGSDLGALNLLSEQADAFDDASEHVGLLFASHAGVAMAGARHDDEFQRGMRTRDVIGQAKGILSERFGIDGDQAFLLLTRASSHTNRKLYDIAAELVGSGRMPDEPGA
jgi:transcriptional regulator with GAF, ATPase, and Fis domain